MRWFIVVGRMYGDDEASALALHTSSSEDAQGAFRSTLRKQNGHPSDDPIPDDGDGAVLIDFTFDCGTHRPRRVIP